MASIAFPGSQPGKITKWRVKKGTRVYSGSLLALYEVEGNSVAKKLKATGVGTVLELLVLQDENVLPGDPVVVIEGCKHPTVMKDMCAECGADLRREEIGKEKENSSASVAMVASIPELIVSEEEAVRIARLDEERLLKNRKLALLVDLDQTLIHTTNDTIPANLKDVYHFQLRFGRNMWYHTKLRPGIEKFLKNVSQLYELHICTFGVRMYAHTIAGFLDPERKLFSHRILSRDECFSPNSKTANLKALFPLGDEMVAIIDDREDVWNFQPNVVHVKPYLFFEGTADINAPPSLKKDEPVGEKRKSKIIRVPKKGSKLVKSKDVGTDLESTNVSSEDPLGNNEKEKLEQEEQCLSKVDTAEVEMTEESAVTEKDGDEVVAMVPEKDGDEVVAMVPEKDGDEVVAMAPEKDGDEVVAMVPEKETTDLSKDQEEGENGEKSQEFSKEVMATQSNSGEQATPQISAELNEDISSVAEQKGPEYEEKQGKAVEGAKVSNEKETHDSVAQEDKSGEKHETHLEQDVENLQVEETSQTSNSENGESVKEAPDENDDEEYEELIEWEDEDDYLLYLEDVLRKVHTAYYEVYDQTKTTGKSEKPDMKKIMPYVRRKILKGTNIVFSGVFPRNMPPEKSRAFMVAKALGANVQTEFVRRGKENATTHVVAAQLGTVKVQQAMKQKGVHVLTVEWLWTCNNRWEHVDERLYYLDPKHDGAVVIRDSPDFRKMRKRKRKRDHKDRDENRSKKRREDKPDSSALHGNKLPDSIEMEDEESRSTKDGNETPGDITDDGNEASTSNPKPKALQRQFSETLSPFISFSQADLVSMGQEVEDLLDEPDSEDSEANEETLRKKVLGIPVDESSSEESLSGDLPRGWNLKKKYPRKKLPSEEGEEDEEELGAVVTTEADQPHRIFKHSDQSSSSDNSDLNESVGSIDEEMAAAVEREFLS